MHIHSILLYQNYIRVTKGKRSVMEPYTFNEAQQSQNYVKATKGKRSVMGPYTLNEAQQSGTICSLEIPWSHKQGTYKTMFEKLTQFSVT